MHWISLAMTHTKTAINHLTIKLIKSTLYLKEVLLLHWFLMKLQNTFMKMQRKLSSLLEVLSFAMLATVMPGLLLVKKEPVVVQFLNHMFVLLVMRRAQQ